MLKKISFIIVLFCQFFLISFAYNDNTIDNLEYSKYGKIYSNEDFGSRLRRLEKDILGMSQTGDVTSRINKLQQVAGYGNYSAIIPPEDNFYPGEKKSAIRRFFDNVSSAFYDPGTITGYTPSLTGSGYYYDSVYGNNYFNSLNGYNRYNPYNRSYRGYNNPFFNNNRYFRNHRPMNNKISSILPSMNTNKVINMNNRFPNHFHRPYRPYRPNSSYSPYGYNPYNHNGFIPTDRITDVATRSSVHILQD